MESSRQVLIERAARELFDNRIGWVKGNSPHAPRAFWADLGAALYGDADPRVRELRDLDDAWVGASEHDSLAVQVALVAELAAGHESSRRALVELIAELSNRNPFPEAEDIADGLVGSGWIAAPEFQCPACGATTRERMAE